MRPARPTSAAIVLLLLATASAAPERVSLDTEGGDPDGPSLRARVSTDGRFVAFASSASDIVGADTNGTTDIFLLDRETGETRRVSLSGDGAEADGPSFNCSVSGDGRFVAFASDATNLVPGDTNGVRDIFVRDTATGATRRISVGPGGAEADAPSDLVFLSADGRWAAFDSRASNLTEGADTNGDYDVFRADLLNGGVEIASVGRDGTRTAGGAFDPGISANGRYVLLHASVDAFSDADPADEGSYGPLVKDMKSGKVYRPLRTTGGAGLDNPAFFSVLSANGKWVATSTDATNLRGALPPGVATQAYRVKSKGGKALALTRAGEAGSNGATSFLSISSNGNVVAFSTPATNLLPGDPTDTEDVYVASVKKRSLAVVSVPDGPGNGDAASRRPALSANGRVVVFDSLATNLAPSDGNLQTDVFLVELQ